MICNDYCLKKNKKEWATYIDSDQEYGDGIYDEYVRRYKVMSLKSRRIHMENVFFKNDSCKKRMGELFKRAFEVNDEKRTYEFCRLYENFMIGKLYNSKTEISDTPLYGRILEVQTKNKSGFELDENPSNENLVAEAGLQNAKQRALLFDSICEKVKIGYEKYEKMKAFLDLKAYKFEFANVEPLIFILMKLQQSFDSLKFVFSDESSEAKFVKSATSFSIEFFYDSKGSVFVSAFKDGNLWAHEYEEKDFSKISEFVNAF